MQKAASVNIILQRDLKDDGALAKLCTLMQLWYPDGKNMFTFRSKQPFETDGKTSPEELMLKLEKRHKVSDITAG